MRIANVEVNLTKELKKALVDQIIAEHLRPMVVTANQIANISINGAVPSEVLKVYVEKVDLYVSAARNVGCSVTYEEAKGDWNVYSSIDENENVTMTISSLLYTADDEYI